MKKTFTTTMPDRVGAFLRASQAIGELGANITRVSYNKAVDTHMLFIEVEAEPRPWSRSPVAWRGWATCTAKPGRAA